MANMLFKMKSTCRMINFNATGLRFLTVTSKCATVCWPKPDYGPREVQRSVMLNGMKVASTKLLGAQIGACTVMFQAGSRYEADEQLGATHFLRVGSNGLGPNFTAFAKTNYLQHQGGYISCSSDRQSISYTLQCAPVLFKDLKHFLLDSVKNFNYHWEIEERRKFVFDDLNRITPEEKVMDLIQRASFAGPLSNSVFSETYHVGIMSEEALTNYKNNNFRSNACSVGSVGIPFDEVMTMADKIETRLDRTLIREEISSPHRCGYESYDLGPKSYTYIAVAVPGCGTKDLGCLLKHAILAAACGTENLQEGQHELDRISQSPLGSLNMSDVYTSARAFNISYFDTGIFGLLAKTPSSSAREVAFHLVNFMKNLGGIDSQQIEIGQRRLKLRLAIEEQNCVKTSEGLALQLATGVEIDNASDVISMIDEICPEEVSCVAEIIRNKVSQMSVAVVGDVAVTPHDGELLN